MLYILNLASIIVFAFLVPQNRAAMPGDWDEDNLMPDATAIGVGGLALPPLDLPPGVPLPPPLVASSWNRPLAPAPPSWDWPSEGFEVASGTSTSAPAPVSMPNPAPVPAFPAPTPAPPPRLLAPAPAPAHNVWRPAPARPAPAPAPAPTTASGVQPHYCCQRATSNCTGTRLKGSCSIMNSAAARLGCYSFTYQSVPACNAGLVQSECCLCCVNPRG